MYKRQLFTVGPTACPNSATKAIAGAITDIGDHILDEGYFTLPNGGFVGLIFWLSSLLGTLAGASYWDTLEWVKNKFPSKKSCALNFKIFDSLK